MFLKVIRYATIALCVFIAFDFSLELISKPDTLLNILGYFIIIFLIALTCEFKCVIKIKKYENSKKED